jgi:hypothetical protein
MDKQGGLGNELRFDPVIKDPFSRQKQDHETPQYYIINFVDNSAVQVGTVLQQ